MVNEIQSGIKDFEPKQPKPSYPQDWTAYNQAQTQEKFLFMHLLKELVSYVIESRPKRKGRPCISVQDMLFCTGMATYVSKSSRRIISDLAIAQEMKYIHDKPHFNSVLNYFSKPELTPVLHDLITLSSLPLKPFEERFTVDSSGFSTSMYAHWFEAKFQGNMQKRIWRKAHVMSGVKTNIITKVEVTPAEVNDSLMFKPLVEHTAKYFTMKEVSADKAYSSRENLRVVHDFQAVPYIAFKKNTTKNSKGYPVWHKMFDFFTKHKEEFLAHYHYRSNAESVFSMIKRKFNTKLRCKNTIGQENEILITALCHNICCLIQETFETGAMIDLNICANMLPAQKIEYF